MYVCIYLIMLVITHVTNDMRRMSRRGAEQHKWHEQQSQPACHQQLTPTPLVGPRCCYLWAAGYMGSRYTRNHRAIYIKQYSRQHENSYDTNKSYSYYRIVLIAFQSTSVSSHISKKRPTVSVQTQPIEIVVVIPKTFPINFSRTIHNLEVKRLPQLILL